MIMMWAIFATVCVGGAIIEILRLRSMLDAPDRRRRELARAHQDASEVATRQYRSAGLQGSCYSEESFGELLPSPVSENWQIGMPWSPAGGNVIERMHDAGEIDSGDGL